MFNIFQSEKPSSGPIYWWNKINKIHKVFLVQSLLTSIFNIFHQGSMVQPDFPPEKPQGRTWLGLLLLLAAAGSAEVRIFNSPSDVFFFF